ncbi:hypothetical protein QQ045_028176 [Rhodiola kirilowii]
MAIAEFWNSADMMRVKDGGPWLCLGTVALIHDWCPDLASEEIAMSRLGVWARLHNLPIGAAMSDKEIGKKLAPHIGRFVKVDSEGTKKKFISVRVEIDIDKPIVKGFHLRRPNRESLWVSVKYERLPNLCSECGRLSHEGEQCKEDRLKDSVELETQSEDEIDGNGKGRQKHIGEEAGAGVPLEHDGKAVGEAYTVRSRAELAGGGAVSTVKMVQYRPSPKVTLEKSQNSTLSRSLYC